MSSFVDLSGKKFGRLVALKRLPKSPGVWWRCQCHCGNLVVARSGDITSGNTKSCGCMIRDVSSALCKKRFKPMAPGTRFGNLTVIRKSEKKLYARGTCWVCRCSCGNTLVCWGTRLRAGKHTQCGCRTSEIISRGRTVHGLSYTRIYRILKGMIQRCENPNHDNYPRYGGRGISVYPAWRSDPKKFVRWSTKHGYRDGLTIDRINNNKSYSPENCRWNDPLTQARNRGNNHSITWRGKTKTVAEWSEITGIKYHTINKRIIKYGWGVEEALTLPPSKNAWRRGERSH